MISEIVTKICNAKLGNMVRNYREENLKRVNDVAFRKTLAVKSEKKIRNIKNNIWFDIC